MPPTPEARHRPHALAGTRVAWPGPAMLGLQVLRGRTHHPGEDGPTAQERTDSEKEPPRQSGYYTNSLLLVTPSASWNRNPKLSPGLWSTERTTDLPCAWSYREQRGWDAP